MYSSRFNQLVEVPKLERWFRIEQNPSRQKLVNYMNLLNASNYRKHNSKITYQQICNWFTNQRATHRSSSQNSNQVQAVTTSAHPPLSIDYRPKFDFTSLHEKQAVNGNVDTQLLQDIQRIDGGSESPTPNEDASVHSTSDGGFDHDSSKNHHDHVSSSPELSLDLNGCIASNSPKSQGNLSAPTLVNGSGSATQTQAASNTVARSRLMFDPLTELPVLEKWFEENPHPTWLQIDQYTDALNSCQYRQSYPPISTHNVKIWFKNRRAKCKRMLSGDVKMEKCC